MKTLSSVALASIYFVAGLGVAQAADLTPPVVKKAIADITVKTGAAPRVINLKTVFGLNGVTQEVVRFTTTLGPIDVELFPATTPSTVANFLGYANRGAAANGGYNGSLIQRLVAGFVMQGGSFYISDHNLEMIATQAAIKSEAGILNTTGTIAMALSMGPDSAQDAWYFNLADNTQLDGTMDGGPFTVFGRVIENGMDTIDAIAALPNHDLSADFGAEGGAFETVPLVKYNTSEGLTAADFVYTDKIALVPVLPVNPGGVGLVQIKILNNSNPDVVTAALTGRKLKLTFHGKHTGMAKITLKAVDTAGEKVKTSFTVKVEE